MEICGLAGSQKINSTVENAKNKVGGAEISFIGTVAEAVKSGKIVIKEGIGMGKLDLMNGMDGIDGYANAEEDEQELVNGFLTRIKRILEKNKKGVK